MFKNFYYTQKRRILSRIVKKKVDFSEISLISQNCIGGIIYHDANQRFLSPTVNLYILPKDFIKFVNNLDYYLSLTPNVEMGKAYPIGTLGDIKINFMHYSSPQEAIEKWEERKQRINFNKIFVIMVERDGFDDEDFNDFLKIKYPKILFTRNEKYISDNSVYLKKFKNEKELPDIIPGRYMYKNMTLVKLVNKTFNKQFRG